VVFLQAVSKTAKSALAALPPLLMTSEPGSFAYRTFAERHPRLLDDIVTWNDYSAEIVAALRALREEITSGVIEPLREKAADKDSWDDSAREHLGKSWLDVPWYWAEAYFWRRILEAVCYFQPGAFYRRDPYASQKLGELAPNAAPRALLSVLRQLPREPAQVFSALTHASLWGNRTDLSYAEVRDDLSSALAPESERANILVDDTAPVWDYLQTARGRINFICDNAGPELLFDLALADFLLGMGLANQITWHVKPQPFFVSDTMIPDVHAALDALGQSAEGELRALTERLRLAIQQTRFVLIDHPFWVTGSFFHEMSEDLRATLAEANLVILKGDANYRRLIGDCHWEPTTPFESAAGYFPATLVALRTLKAELIVGLRPGEEERLTAEDPAWRVNGKRGVIQFLRK
jgi:uncharacterized protein with ATP-grasp and redox domains